MQKLPLILATALAWCTAGLSSVQAQYVIKGTEVAEVAYTHTITKRSAEIVAALALTEAAKSNRVQEILVTQYRALNTWHEQHDEEIKGLNKSATGDKEAAEKAKAKVAAIQATLKPTHDSFLAKLAAELSPEQVELVKDKMTYGKVQFTYKGFLQAVPDMTEEEKAHVLELLKEARELAIDGSSAEEKTAIFGKYKGKINNYLSARGHDIGGKSKPKPAPSAPAGK